MESVIVCYYNKNLKMTPPKLASQVAHAVSNLILKTSEFSADKIIVLEAREAKFKRIIKELKEAGVAHYTQTDLGFTEVAKGTDTTVAYWERI